MLYDTDPFNNGGSNCFKYFYVQLLKQCQPPIKRTILQKTPYVCFKDIIFCANYFTRIYLKQHKYTPILRNNKISFERNDVHS